MAPLCPFIFSSFLSWELFGQHLAVPEKMNFFWIDHFGNESSDIGNANWVYKQHTTIRQHTLGNYKQMVRDITLDYGMLRYLNGYLNTANSNTITKFCTMEFVIFFNFFVETVSVGARGIG